VGNLLIGLLSAAMATNQPVAVSNFVAATTGLSVNVPDPNDPVEKEYRKVMEEDDAATDEVDKWIRENQAFVEKGGGAPKDVLNHRIRERLGVVRKAYEDFLKRHPDHARAHLAFGAFLDDMKQEDAAAEEFEKARQLDPKNPAPWNNLANHFGHDGPIRKAFEYYEKAIELDSTQSVYYRNLGDIVFLFRKDSKEYYHLDDDQQVFDRALKLYDKALQLDPHNFPVAQDLAQTYYGIKPFRTDAALRAWTNALNIATTDIEREGVYVHFARIELNAGNFNEARGILGTVTNEMYTVLKTRLLKNLSERENQARETNAPPAKPEDTHKN